MVNNMGVGFRVSSLFDLGLTFSVMDLGFQALLNPEALTRSPDRNPYSATAGTLEVPGTTQNHRLPF